MSAGHILVAGLRVAVVLFVVRCRFVGRRWRHELDLQWSMRARIFLHRGLGSLNGRRHVFVFEIQRLVTSGTGLAIACIQRLVAALAW